ncbi:MAG TPA: PA2169 family four-helix-bundle protein [Planctomycetota bacterium]|nr:PA2169 family four-helix-bundle protein [Planctomycetota bacterium]
MPAEDPEAILRLDELIELCKDGHARFGVAASLAADPRAREAFACGALKHLQFVHELQAEVRALGGDPDLSPDGVRPLHRNWIALRAARRAHDADAALNECENCEDQALLAYADALAALPLRARSLVRRQELQLRLTRALLQALREAMARVRG